MSGIYEVQYDIYNLSAEQVSMMKEACQNIYSEPPGYTNDGKVNAAVDREFEKLWRIPVDDLTPRWEDMSADEQRSYIEEAKEFSSI